MEMSRSVSPRASATKLTARQARSSRAGLRRNDGERVGFGLAIWCDSGGHGLQRLVADATIVLRMMILTTLNDAVPTRILDASLASFRPTEMDAHS